MWILYLFSYFERSLITFMVSGKNIQEENRGVLRSIQRITETQLMYMNLLCQDDSYRLRVKRLRPLSPKYILGTYLIYIPSFEPGWTLWDWIIFKGRYLYVTKNIFPSFYSYYSGRLFFQCSILKYYPRILLPTNKSQISYIRLWSIIKRYD